jgi:hypothetical protein
MGVERLRVERSLRLVERVGRVERSLRLVLKVER